MTVVLASVAFWAPVHFPLVGDDGLTESVACRARYRRLKTSERRALDRRIRANALGPDVRAAIRDKLADARSGYTEREREEIEADLSAETITDAEFLAHVLVDWDLKDRSGQAVIFSPATLAQVCEAWDGFEAALVRAYGDAMKAAGRVGEQEKNSEAPSGTGS